MLSDDSKFSCCKITCSQYRTAGISRSYLQRILESVSNDQIGSKWNTRRVIGRYRVQPSSVFRSLRRSLSTGNTMRPTSEQRISRRVTNLLDVQSSRRTRSFSWEREIRSLVENYAGGGQKFGEKLRTRRTNPWALD